MFLAMVYPMAIELIVISLVSPAMGVRLKLLQGYPQGADTLFISLIRDSVVSLVKTSLGGRMISSLSLCHAFSSAGFLYQSPFSYWPCSSPSASVRSQVNFPALVKIDEAFLGFQFEGSRPFKGSGIWIRHGSNSLLLCKDQVTLGDRFFVLTFPISSDLEVSASEVLFSS